MINTFWPTRLRGTPSPATPPTLRVVTRLRRVLGFHPKPQGTQGFALTLLGSMVLEPVRQLVGNERASPSLLSGANTLSGPRDLRGLRPRTPESASRPHVAPLRWGFAPYPMVRGASPSPFTELKDCGPLGVPGALRASPFTDTQRVYRVLRVDPSGRRTLCSRTTTAAKRPPSPSPRSCTPRTATAPFPAVTSLATSSV